MAEKKTVLVAMSGGVDSSVAAALLKEQGYNLIGVTMEIGAEDGSVNSAINDARKVAQDLDIPFQVINFRDLFQDKVINYFMQAYLDGKTPNPCIACNQHLKFAALLEKAVSLGVDYLATGHYARVLFEPELNRFVLKKAIDQKKDQTYVLYHLTQAQLSKTLLPLGDFTKNEIREKAREMGLTEIAEKPESQEICFITDNDYRRFLREKVGTKIKPGSFFDKDGKIIGNHLGIPYYTIGQRKGLGIALGKPAYVIDLISENNAVVIGDQSDLLKENLTSSSNNFVLIDNLAKPMEVTVKIRYQAKEAPALISPLGDNKVLVEFLEPEKSITPGQSVVYYQDDYVVGGGIIL